MPFEDLKLREELMKSIKLMGYVEPTAIQAKCIPLIMQGKDVIGQSLTGSGKTAAFGLPILGNLTPGAGIQLLVLTPTRELCQQVRDNLDQMSKFMPVNIYAIYGGVGFFQQFEDIKNAEVIVATPGRLLDHIRRGTIRFKDVKYVVLDEADKMLEMGFEEDVEQILKHTPKERQTVFFSATMPSAALRMIHKYMKNPTLVKEKLQVDRSLLKQVYYDVPFTDKFSLLVKLIKDNLHGSAIVFCGTKRTVDKVARNLRKQNINAMAVHGDITQSKRIQAVEFLKSGKIDILVATDVAARGLDIKDVTHVYNYDIPRNAEEYTHRIGRTARAGKKGDAVNLVCERDYRNFETVLRDRTLHIVEEPLPTFDKVEFVNGGRESFGDDRGRGGFGGRGERRERRVFGGGGRRSFGGRGERSDRGDRGRSFGGGRSFGNEGRRDFEGNDFGRRDNRSDGGRSFDGHGRGKPPVSNEGPKDNFYQPRPAYSGPKTNSPYPSSNPYSSAPRSHGQGKPFDRREQHGPRTNSANPSHGHNNKNRSAPFYGKVAGNKRKKF